MLRKIYWYLFVYDLDIPHEDTASENIGGSKRLLHDITRAVLVCYLLLIFNSLIPLTADAVAHTFWKDEHIAAVHNVKGKVHVEEDLIKVSKQAEKTESSGIKSIDISLHLLPVVALSFILFFLLIIRYPILPTGTPGTYVPKTYKPPRLSPSF